MVRTSASQNCFRFREAPVSEPSGGSRGESAPTSRGYLWSGLTSAATRMRRALVQFSLSAVLLAAPSLSAKPLAEYKIGDRVEEDVVTDSPLIVLDAEATAVLKEREVERVPVIFRFDPDAIRLATNAFHESFVQARGNFLGAVERTFNQSKLDPAALDSAQFSQLTISFQRRNYLFPVTPDLARIWASGESDQAFEAPLLNSLRDSMKLLISATNVAPSGATIGSTVRLVSCRDNETLTEQMVARGGVDHAKTEFISLQRARTDLLNTFPPEYQAVARHLTSFVRPNCFIDDQLTIAMRTKRAEQISATRAFAAGEIIARSGDVVDKQVMTAVDALNEKNIVLPIPPVASVGTKPAIAGHKNVWLIAGAAGAGGAVTILFAAAIMIARRRSPVSLLPAAADRGNLVAPSTALEESWRRRALLAERRAEEAQAMIRRGFIAQLAYWMSDKLVQKLLSQRTDLLEAQYLAVTQADRLGQRLETIQSRMQDRLAAYEHRIAELEKELDSKYEINRELIQAEIQTIRRQLATERAEGVGGLN
jgi:hypothetical protein